jgi:hypothetical protein
MNYNYFALRVVVHIQPIVLATQILFFPGLYKIDDINKNEFLIINLASVQAGRIKNTSSSSSPKRHLPLK